MLEVFDKSQGLFEAFVRGLTSEASSLLGSASVVRDDDILWNTVSLGFHRIDKDGRRSVVGIMLKVDEITERSDWPRPGAGLTEGDALAAAEELGRQFAREKVPEEYRVKGC